MILEHREGRARDLNLTVATFQMVIKATTLDHLEEVCREPEIKL